jgi:tetratricopeptide (TPR) repeat protein
MRRSLSLLLLLLLSLSNAKAQKDSTGKHFTDSLNKNLSAARTDAQKIYWMIALAQYYVGVDNERSQKYAEQAMEVAELSRDRKLIALTWIECGNRLMNMAHLEDNMTQAMDCFQRAEKTARASDLEDELGFAYIGMARAARGKGNYNQALNYNNLAVSIASASSNDSLKVQAYNSIGNTYRYRNEKLLAFRNYLDAMNVAELAKRDDLVKLVNDVMVDFYVTIEEYDKALDYAMKSIAIDRNRADWYSLLEDYDKAGRVFTLKKQMDLALTMYEKAIALADSMKFSIYSLNTYLNIANMYFNNNEVRKGVDYLNAHPQLLAFFRHAGMGAFLDLGYGSIYSELDKYDSAYYFFKRAEPETEQKASPFAKYEFYRQFGDFYKRKKDYTMAIAYYLKAWKIGSETGDIRELQVCAKNLDTLYDRAGDFKTAYSYNILYNQFKDSIQSLGKEAEVLKLEVDNDNRRRERLNREEEEKTLRRHNIQYMGFTAGIAALFVVLVMLGFFMVSPRTIRAVGFFSFIFLFEFIILLADKQIHEWTHGEPWKILLIKIFLAAVLLPLHHWLEHKVIHYLSTRRKITPSGGWWFKKKGGTPGAEAGVTA